MRLGIDVVDVSRLDRMLGEVPGLRDRLFTTDERSYCDGTAEPIVHYAGTLACKEAVMKACGLASLPAWARRIEVRRSGGAPRACLRRGEGSTEVQVSISHDGGVAVAVAFGE